MIKLIDIVVNLLQKHTHFEYSLLLPTLLLWGALLFLTHVFSGISLYLNNFVKVAQKNLIFTIYADVLITTLSIALFFLMVFIILSKLIGVGAIAGYIQAFSSTEQQLQDLSFYGKWFFAINKYFENYFCILDYKIPKPETQIKLEEKIHSITFENISFSYPNSKLIFENFNLSLTL